MSGDNVEFVERCYAAFNAGAWDEVAAAGDPGITLEEPPELPAPERREGRDAVVRYLRSFERIWTDSIWEIEELIDADDKVIAVVRFRATGRASQAQVEMRWAHVWTIRDRKALRIQAFSERTGALEAAGVSE